MICKLCHSFFLEEDSIFGLFSFSELCQECKEKYSPSRLYEVFPIRGGIVEYHYLYDDLSLNVYQKQYLSKYLSVFYLDMLSNDKNFDLFIFLDDDVLFEDEYLGLFINGFNNVFMFSLMRKEIIYKDIF
ncbi:hypothetical protein KHQ88_05415 [Mycoplasmatota bacterium]|nr:hypothetical protein KHQ88_05415 [Mycoplasmatota bacterium]